MWSFLCFAFFTHLSFSPFSLRTSVAPGAFIVFISFSFPPVPLSLPWFAHVDRNLLFFLMPLFLSSCPAPFPLEPFPTGGGFFTLVARVGWFSFPRDFPFPSSFHPLFSQDLLFCLLVMRCKASCQKF